MFKIVLLFLLFISVTILYADVVYLKDGKILSGSIINFNNDNFELLTEKDRIKLSKNEISIIVLESDKPSPNFSSPKKTFEFWKRSAIKRDLFGLSLCYEKAFRANKLKELQSFTETEIKDMSKKTKKSDFVIDPPVILGDRATMKVERIYKKKKMLEFVEFVLEDGEWRMSE